MLALLFYNLSTFFKVLKIAKSRSILWLSLTFLFVALQGSVNCKIYWFLLKKSVWHMRSRKWVFCKEIFMDENPVCKKNSLKKIHAKNTIVEENWIIFRDFMLSGAKHAYAINCYTRCDMLYFSAMVLPKRSCFVVFTEVFSFSFQKIRIKKLKQLLAFLLASSQFSNSYLFFWKFKLRYTTLSRTVFEKYLQNVSEIVQQNPFEIC